MLKLFSAFAMTVLIAACGGGGGDAGTPPFGGGNGGGTTTAADLTLALSAPTLENTGSKTITATVTAVDANRNALSGIAVSVSVDSNATVVVSGPTTSATGVVTGTIDIGGDKSNRVVTVTARSGSISKTASFAVTGAKLQATVKPEFTVGESGTVEYALTDSNSTAMPNTSVSFTAPGGVTSEALTDINGQVSFPFTAPAAPGPFEISAVGAGFTLASNLNANSGPTSIPNAVGVVESASILVSPNVIAVNTDATSNRAEVRALFVGASNKPVKNIRARFDLNGDVNTIGGSLSSGTSYVYSDDSGISRTNYFSGTRSSPTNGVSIRVCWDYRDFAAAACPNSAIATLTVVSEPLSVSIGTNNLLEEGVNQLTYIQRYVVQVVDASGQAKADVLVTPELKLTRYYKGQWFPGEDGWFQSVVAPTTGCENEDVDADGRNDVFTNGDVEDANGTGALEPRAADVAISIEGSARTDASGKVIVKIEYAKNFGSWIDYRILVGASGIGGTEGRTNFIGTLGVLAADASDPTVAPPFQYGPYGTQSGLPMVTVTDPNSGASAQLCTNPN